MEQKRRYYEAYEERYRQVHGEGLQWSSDSPSEIVGQVIQKYGITKQAQMLEIGCGEGRDAAYLLKEGYHLLATDLSGEAIAYCREKYPDFRENFCTLDCLNERLEQKFDFIYAVAVLHMFVLEEDRSKFYQFIGEHLKENGVALIGTMGDGKMEVCSNPEEAFPLQRRTHGQTGREMMLAGTSCRVVSFDTFQQAIHSAGLKELEMGLTSILPDFPTMMVAVIKAEK